MSVTSLDKVPKHHLMASLQSIWATLTKPSTLLRNDDKPKARLLAALLSVFIPIAIVTVFANPLTTLFTGNPTNPPAPGQILAIPLVLVAYIFSRTRYYAVGAWLLISIALISVFLPILMTGVLTSIIPLFYLTMSVIIAGLLLSSRETLIVGAIIVALVLVTPQVTAAATPATVNQNLYVFLYIALATAITVLVGRIRENNLRQLEQGQIDLSRSLAEKEEAVIQANRSRERAERSDQVKSAFLASMSHELRTPLNSIINFTEFVVDGDTGPINAEQKDLLMEVVSSSKHLLNLINDVLDMSKIEAGSLKLFIEDDINLKIILGNSISTCRSLLKESVHMQAAIEENLPLIRGDRQRILQIMLNIISNACKFTEQGDIKISAHQAKGEIIISVVDSGPGIACEDQTLVFEAFKQASTGLRQGGGTGLGMPIAKNLAEAHGGRLWLESEFGKGTTFYVALPIKSEELVPVL